MMHFRFPNYSIGTKEHRLTKFARESSFGEHMKDAWDYTKETYVESADGVVDSIGSIVAGGVYAVLKGPDEIFKGAVGQKFNRPTGIMGNTIADTRSFARNLFTLHPIRAAGDAWSIATADLWVDGTNLVTGKNLSA